MKLTIHPVPKNRRSLGELFDAMKDSGVQIKQGDSLGEVIVESASLKTAEKILNIHGYQIEKESNLSGAMSKLAETFDFGQPRPDDDIKPRHFSKKEYPTTRGVTPRVNKASLIKFVQRKARNARNARSKSRSQHTRNNLDGQTIAYEDILRYLKKR